MVKITTYVRSVIELARSLKFKASTETPNTQVMLVRLVERTSSAQWQLLQHVAIKHNEEDEILNHIIFMVNGKADTDGDGRKKKTLRMDI